MNVNISKCFAFFTAAEIRNIDELRVMFNSPNKQPHGSPSAAIRPMFSSVRAAVNQRRQQAPPSLPPLFSPFRFVSLYPTVPRFLGPNVSFVPVPNVNPQSLPNQYYGLYDCRIGQFLPLVVALPKDQLHQSRISSSSCPLPPVPFSCSSGHSLPSLPSHSNQIVDVEEMLRAFSCQQIGSGNVFEKESKTMFNNNHDESHSSGTNGMLSNPDVTAMNNNIVSHQAGPQNLCLPSNSSATEMELLTQLKNMVILNSQEQNKEDKEALLKRQQQNVLAVNLPSCFGSDIFK